MAIRGRNFLRVTRRENLSVSRHALNRIQEYTGVDVDEAGAQRRFEDGRHQRIDDVRLAGYRPDFDGRIERGLRSHYFVIEAGGEELLAVLQEDLYTGDLVWITTYPSSRKNVRFLNGN